MPHHLPLLNNVIGTPKRRWIRARHVLTHPVEQQLPHTSEPRISHLRDIGWLRAVVTPITLPACSWPAFLAKFAHPRGIVLKGFEAVEKVHRLRSVGHLAEIVMLLNFFDKLLRKVPVAK